MAAGAQIVVDLDDATTELATLSPYDIVFSISGTTLRARYNAELFDVDSIDELLKQALMPHALPMPSHPSVPALSCAHPDTLMRTGQEGSAVPTQPRRHGRIWVAVAGRPSTPAGLHRRRYRQDLAAHDGRRGENRIALHADRQRVDR